MGNEMLLVSCNFEMLYTKDTIYKIRNDVCLTFVDNHATYQFLYSTFLPILKTAFPKSIRLLVKQYDMYH